MMPMNIVSEIDFEKLKADLKKSMEERSMTTYSLAQELGIAYVTLWSFVTGRKKSFHSATVRKILDRLGLNVWKTGRCPACGKEKV
jgi:predicted transcriptional regulator